MSNVSSLKQFNQMVSATPTQDHLRNVLGAKAPQFVCNLTSLVANNTNLQQCEPVSLMYAALKATSLELPFDSNLGFAYVIPFWSGKNKRYEGQFQIGYKGFIQLALRSGQFTTLNVREVREGEIVGEDFVTGEMQFKALPADERLNAPVIGYMAFFRLVNGFSKMLYMSKEEMTAHATRYSQTYSNDKTKSGSKWSTDFDAMARKTALKMLLSKYAPMSIQMLDAIQADQAVIGKDDKYTYIDNDSVVDVQVATAEIAEAVMAETEANEAVIESVMFN